METGATAVRMGWIAYVIPFVFVLSPSLLCQGELSDIIIATITAFAGVWIASCGLIGYLFGPLSPIMRLLFFVSGILLLLPADAIPYGLVINAAGLILAVIVVMKDLGANKEKRKAAKAGAAAE